jgi:prepilin-type N-terminal cleavage/methylation domain-containing protein
MIRFKNHKMLGFTLMEVMLAMTIIGIILTPIFGLHTMIMQRMSKSSKRLYALLEGKALLFEARQKQDVQALEFTLDKKFEESSVDAKYTLQQSPDPKSTLTQFEGLRKETIALQWIERGNQQHETLVAFVYKQSEQKKS